MYNLYYIAIFALMSIGLFIVIDARNLIKKMIGLALFQNAILLFFIGMANVKNFAIPFANLGIQLVNPLPHVLMLTAIVVGVATLATGLFIIMKIKND